jgi:hypothetical protein
MRMRTPYFLQDFCFWGNFRDNLALFPLFPFLRVTRYGGFMGAGGDWINLLEKMLAKNLGLD